MSQSKGWCPQCSAMKLLNYEYQRYPEGALVIVVCTDCGYKVEDFRKWKD